MKKHLLRMLVGMILCSLLLLNANAFAARQGRDEQVRTKVKADVTAIGVGARVVMKLHDKRELTGYVTQIGDDNIVITVAKEGTKQTVAFADVMEVKKRNENRISTAGKIL